MIGDVFSQEIVVLLARHFLKVLGFVRPGEHFFQVAYFHIP